jgi:hypothetical protein
MHELDLDRHLAIVEKIHVIIQQFPRLVHHGMFDRSRP